MATAMVVFESGVCPDPAAARAMHQVIPEHYAELHPFFTDPPPNDPMVRAFLRGDAPGQAFVDVPRRPQACVVAMNYSFVFFGGVSTPQFQEHAITRLRREQRLQVVWKAGWVRLPKGPTPDAVVRRLEFRRRADRAGAGLETLRRLAPEVTARRIDAALFQRCRWRADVLKAVGSASEFLAHGVGFCAMLGEDIVAEAYSCFWTGDRVEIAVVTHPEYRGRGFATSVCAHLIHACEGLGLRTYWSCDADNQASLRLAAKLGYFDSRAYRLLRYEQV